jgi:hypothetical protein
VLKFLGTLGDLKRIIKAIDNEATWSRNRNSLTCLAGKSDGCLEWYPRTGQIKLPIQAGGVLDRPSSSKENWGPADEMQPWQKTRKVTSRPSTDQFGIFILGWPPWPTSRGQPMPVSFAAAELSFSLSSPKRHAVWISRSRYQRWRISNGRPPRVAPYGVGLNREELIFIVG